MSVVDGPAARGRVRPTLRPHSFVVRRAVAAGRRHLAGLAGTSGLVLLPLVLRAADRPAYLTAAVLSLVIALAALSLVVLVGWVGQLSLAQFAFMGIGALVVARLSPYLGFWAALPLAGLIAVPAGLVAAVPALRLRGIYLAVATLGFGQVVESAVLLNVNLAGGPQLHVDPPPLGRLRFTDDLQGRFSLYYVVLGILAGFVLFTLALRGRRTGRAFFAVRDDEVAAASVGIDVVGYKLLAFGLSAFYAGVAGGLFMLLNNDVAADAFDPLRGSIPLLIVLVLGGVTSVAGAIVAGFLYAMGPLVVPPWIDSLLRALHAPVTFNSDLVYALFGAGLIVGLATSPQGMSTSLRLLRRGPSVAQPASVSGVTAGGEG